MYHIQVLSVLTLHDRLNTCVTNCMCLHVSELLPCVALDWTSGNLCTKVSVLQPIGHDNIRTFGLCAAVCSK